MILFLAGTSDARELAVQIQTSGFPLLATVVTENGAKELRQAGVEVQVGRLSDQEIASLVKEKGFHLVVDASHPFAEEASKNAKSGASIAGVPYIRYEREQLDYENELVIKVDSYEEAAEAAAEKGGVVFLATGSKTLEIFAAKLLPLPDIRLIARMLPRLDNMEKCEKLGIPQKNIVAIQGPFTKEFNTALFRQYGVTVMISKESGKEGSVDEKLDAAIDLGIQTIMIGRPKIQYGTVYSSFGNIIEHIRNLLVPIK
ncbi:precorrin-6A reductase [Peribacillus saganii]|uniref:Precorrin-6A reductase n=1 Tax=Peribacillus saganii TaxID=2303992 RepID=A0A372LES2_9BACI|nr:precorrin-6A reductase [Peribacillus saganii]RFU64518.1 precorrin-6A reductase [Peribacillus saganii]